MYFVSILHICTSVESEEESGTSRKRRKISKKGGNNVQRGAKGKKAKKASAKGTWLHNQSH